MRGHWAILVIANILILGTFIAFIPYQNAFAVTTDIATDTSGDQTVNPGDTLTITSGATLTGDVTVDGGTLVINGATVNGDIEANCQSVTITDSTINGDVKAENCDSVNIKDSEIFGDLEIESVNEVDIENGSFTNIELQANNDISVSGTSTDGDIEIEQANSLTFSANIIVGDLKIEDVVDCTVSGNIIIGDTEIDPNCLLTPIIAGGHLVFDFFSATNVDANTSTVFSNMLASFEAAEGTGLFGIVAFGEQNKHLAVASHIGIADSEIPGGGADGTSHTHVLKVKVTEDCEDFIINPDEFDGLAIKSVSFEQIGTLTITDFDVSGDTLDISDIFAEGVGGQLSGDGASFELVLVDDDICIDIKNTIP